MTFFANPQGFDVLLQEEKFINPIIKIAINASLFIDCFLTL